jgi:hypothetical protein
MIVKDAAGTTVLTLGDTALVSGYLGTLYQEGDAQYNRTNITSLFVNGDFEVIASLGGRILTLDVFIEGTDWADATAKHTALLNAVQVRRWKLTVGSVTWTCRAADSTSPIPPGGTTYNWRTVSLSIPVDQRRGI